MNVEHHDIGPRQLCSLFQNLRCRLRLTGTGVANDTGMSLEELISIHPCICPVCGVMTNTKPAPFSNADHAAKPHGVNLFDLHAGCRVFVNGFHKPARFHAADNGAVNRLDARNLAKEVFLVNPLLCISICKPGNHGHQRDVSVRHLQKVIDPDILEFLQVCPDLDAVA